MKPGANDVSGQGGTCILPDCIAGFHEPLPTNRQVLLSALRRHFADVCDIVAAFLCIG